MPKVRATILMMVLALAACTKSHVQSDASYGGSALARPDHVLVSYFSISPDQVKLDQGVAARLRRATSDQPLSTQELQAAQAAQTELAEKLVEYLRRYGLPASLATSRSPPGSSLLVEGQIVGIDQGNRTRRTLIGLGAGKSTVSADAQLFYAAGPVQPRFLTAFEGQADSGHMPGAAETMGAGAVGEHLATSAALTGATHGAGEMRRASDSAEANNLADGLAKQIGMFAASQGWIPQTAVQ